MLLQECPHTINKPFPFTNILYFHYTCSIVNKRYNAILDSSKSPFSVLRIFKNVYNKYLSANRKSGAFDRKLRYTVFFRLLYTDQTLTADRGAHG